MSPEIIALYIGLGLTILTMVAGFVRERIKTATVSALMDQAIKTLQKDYDAHIKDNGKEHDEFYKMRDVLIEIKTEFNGFKTIQGTMSAKIDTLLERRGNNRE